MATATVVPQAFQTCKSARRSCRIRCLQSKKKDLVLSRNPGLLRPHLTQLTSFTKNSVRVGTASVVCAAEGSNTSPDPAPTSEKRFLWSKATVVQNRAASADGSVRTLVLSVEDDVAFFDGRKRKHVQDSPRWIDRYKLPGQKVGLRLPDAGGDSGPQRMFAVSSSPYATHYASADLAAGIIELLVEHGASDLDEALANLGPGATLEVTEIAGTGFGSVFDPEVGLLSCLEEGRSLVMIAQGTAGIAALRPCVEWTPVQAHATEHRVTLIYLCKGAGSAAFLKDWDGWREAGVKVKPVYYASSEEGGAPAISDEEALDKLAIALYNDDGLSGLVGQNVGNCAFILAGECTNAIKRCDGAGKLELGMDMAMYRY